MSNEKFDDGSTSGYAELPVPFAWLRWTRGESKLAALKTADPGLYYGGWRASVTRTDPNTNETHENPRLPLPIVERVSEDGKYKFQVYATNVLNFLPIQNRQRFELRERIKDPNTGKEREKIVAVSLEQIQGYAPSRQVFGLVFSANGSEYAPAVLFINKWSSFISFNKAGAQWKKSKAPEGMVLVRRYGSIGDAKGNPKFETFGGQGRSTPIEAIDISNPNFIKVIPEFDELFENSLAWKNCDMWLREGKQEEATSTPLVQKFNAACDEARLSNIEIEQLLKEQGGNMAKALQALTVGEEDVNSKLATAEEEDFPF